MMRRKLLIGVLTLWLSVFIASAQTVSAVNECGTVAAGGTVTCNNSGTPATNVSPYAAGITYSVPVTINLDGSVTPLTISGVVNPNTTTNAPSYIIVRGAVSMTRTGNLPIANLGNSVSRTRPLFIDIGNGFTYSGNRTTTGGQYYAIIAHGNNTTTSIINHGSITSRAVGGASAWHGALSSRDITGGVNSKPSIINSGALDLTTGAATGSSSTFGMYAGSTGVGSPEVVVAENTGPITLTSTATGAHYGLGIQAVNYGSGGVKVQSAGPIAVNGEWGLGSSSPFPYGIYADAPVSPTVVTVTAPITMNTAGLAWGLQSESTVSHMVTIDAPITIMTTSGTGAGVVLSDAGTYQLRLLANAHIKSPQSGVIFDGTSSGTMSLESGARIEAPRAITGSGANDVLESSGAITGATSMGAGNDSVTLKNGSYTGTIAMGDGDDTVEISDTVDVTGLTEIDGGAGVNTLVIDGNTLRAFSTTGNGVRLINFASIEIRNSAAVTLGGVELMTSDGTGNITIASNATLGIADESGVFTLEGSLAHDGRVSLHQTNEVIVGDKVVVTGKYFTNGGLLAIDAQLDALGVADVLSIQGDVSVGDKPTTIQLASVKGLGAQTTGKGILVVSVDGNSPHDAFVLEGGSVAAGNFTYRLVQDDEDGNWYLRSTPIPVAEQPSTETSLPQAPNTGLKTLTAGILVSASVLAVLFVAMIALRKM